MQPETDVIPDDALVVRGGKNRPEDVDRGIGMHPSGIVGISVNAAVGVDLDELVQGIPHGDVGLTTVARVRQAGGDVIRTSGRNRYHATLVGLSPEEVSRLMTPTRPNPARRQAKAKNANE
jgi:hypothetical protein